MGRKLPLGKVLGTPKINNLARKTFLNKSPSRIYSRGSAASVGHRKEALARLWNPEGMTTCNGTQCPTKAEPWTIVPPARISLTTTCSKGKKPI
eukprot:4912417-Heterocapsa_arctica.AAC.1